MKTISIYELLGLIKDGEASKKIKFRSAIYELREEEKDYECIDKKRTILQTII